MQKEILEKKRLEKELQEEFERRKYDQNWILFKNKNNKKLFWW